mmetsp:Transcript_10882/g.21872  ORF Transcript_10882/g.21872 Transcript_10882/m.21872 type:complete len:855 (-) Transcript_10882:230-2794(-)
MNLYETLSFAQDVDLGVRKNAELYLNELDKKNPDKFFFELIEVFGDESAASEIRGLAGLILKNKIVSFNQNEKNRNKKEKPSSIGNFFEKETKELLVKIFESFSKIARRTASQIFAKITSIEILEGEDKHIFKNLCVLLSKKKSLHLHCSVLETIDFICQESQNPLFVKNLTGFSEEILEIIVNSLKISGEQNLEIKFAALNTLNTFIPFMVDIINKKDARSFIFKLILDQLSKKEKKIRAITFEILGKIAQDYYTFLDHYISVIFDFTILTLKGDDELVTLQAIELWSTIADTEFELTTNSIQAINEGRVPLEYSRNFILQSNSLLHPFLLGFIKDHNTGYENDEWNCCAAAGTCLNLMSQAAPSEIISNTIRFIEKNLLMTSSSKSKEGASLAFVAVLDGIGSKMLYSHAIKMLPLWQYYLEDIDPSIQSIITWTIGKICHNTPYILRVTLDRIIQAIIINLVNQRTFYKTCWAFNEILQVYGKEGLADWCTEGVFFSLFNFIWFQEPENSMIDEIFEVFCSAVLNSSVRNKNRIVVFIPVLLLKLLESTKIRNCNQIRKIQSHICRVLGCIVQRLGKKINPNLIEQLIKALILIVSSIRDETINWTLEEEILVCLGTIIQKSQKKLFGNLGELTPFLLKCLENENNYQTCSLAIGVIGDICRTADSEIELFVEQVAGIIFSILKNNNTISSIKPLILVCLGDLSLTERFLSREFYETVVKIFKETAAFLEDFENSDDIEIREWNLQIKESVLEGMVSIIQSNQNKIQKNESAGEKLKWVCKFLFKTLSNNRTSRMSEGCTGLVGDLSLNFHFFRKTLTKCPWVRQLLFESKNSSINKIKTLGAWAYELVIN